MASEHKQHSRLADWLRTNRLLIIILALALVLRAGAALYLGNEVSGLSGAYDEISYSMLGQRFAAGHGMTFPTDWYPWIGANAPQSYYSYTISVFLAGIYRVLGYQPLAARMIMAVLSTLIVLMVYLLSRRFFDERVALLAAGIAAVYAYLVFYGVTLLTETPFTLALLVTIYLGFRVIDRPHWLGWIVLGIALAVTVLLRMAVVFFLPFFFLWLLLQLPDWRHRLYLLIPICLIVAAILPLTIRNALMWDRFLLLESQFGHVFWNGNHPDHHGDFHPYKVFPIPDDVLSSKNDAMITNQLLRLGVQNVLNDPADFGRLTITRLREFFTFWPTSDSTRDANLLRVLSFGLLVPFAIAGLLLNLKNWRVLSIVYIFIIIHTGVYAISWTMIRYRVPLDPFFIMFGSSAILMGIKLWQERVARPDVYPEADFSQSP